MKEPRKDTADQSSLESPYQVIVQSRVDLIIASSLSEARTRAIENKETTAFINALTVRYNQTLSKVVKKLNDCLEKQTQEQKV